MEKTYSTQKELIFVTSKERSKLSINKNPIKISGLFFSISFMLVFV